MAGERRAAETVGGHRVTRRRTVVVLGNLTMDKPAPDAAKLLAGRSGRRARHPGKVLANLKTAGMPELLRSLIEDAPERFGSRPVCAASGQADRRSSSSSLGPTVTGTGGDRPIMPSSSPTGIVDLPPSATRSRSAILDGTRLGRAVCSTRRTTVRMFFDLSIADTKTRSAISFRVVAATTPSRPEHGVVAEEEVALDPSSVVLVGGLDRFITVGSHPDPPLRCGQRVPAEGMSRRRRGRARPGVAC